MPLQLSIVPEKAIVVRRERTIVAASWFGRWIRRPYIYPFLGPGRTETTRLGHPMDPVGHSHHRSIWIGHASVGGVDFWGDSPRSGHIVQEEILERSAGSGERVEALVRCSWKSQEGREILRENRRLTFHDLPGDELALDLDMELRAPGEKVELGVTNFGLLGIRVARTLRVQEGLGGTIVNSEEAENESGCFGQHALWCDYSGPVPLAGDLIPGPPGEKASAGELAAAVLGVACFDHPANGVEESLWHVRDDGWMGPSFTRTSPRTVEKDRPLRLRYRIIAHAGHAWQASIGERYRAWRRAVLREEKSD